MTESQGLLPGGVIQTWRRCFKEPCRVLLLTMSVCEIFKRALVHVTDVEMKTLTDAGALLCYLDGGQGGQFCNQVLEGSNCRLSTLTHIIAGFCTYNSTILPRLICRKQDLMKSESACIGVGAFPFLISIDLQLLL